MSEEKEPLSKIAKEKLENASRELNELQVKLKAELERNVLQQALLEKRLSELNTEVKELSRKAKTKLANEVNLAVDEINDQKQSCGYCGKQGATVTFDEESFELTIDSCCQDAKGEAERKVSRRVKAFDSLETFKGD